MRLVYLFIFFSGALACSQEDVSELIYFMRHHLFRDVETNVDMFFDSFTDLPEGNGFRVEGSVNPHITNLTGTVSCDGDVLMNDSRSKRTFIGRMDLQSKKFYAHILHGEEVAVRIVLVAEKESSCATFFRE
jgi:hypothetical protein